MGGKGSRIRHQGSTLDKEMEKRIAVARAEEGPPQQALGPVLGTIDALYRQKSLKDC